MGLCFSGLDSIIDGGLDLAFDFAGSFTKIMYFKCESESTYDPETSQVVEKVITTGPFRGIIGKAKDVDLTSQGIAPTPEMLEVTVKKKDVPENYHRYDTLHWEDVDHRITHYIDDGFTIKFFVSTR
jgi:hypothetical protein